MMRLKSVLFFLLLAIVISPAPAKADHQDSYLQLTCIPELNYFSVSDIKIEDTDTIYKEKVSGPTQFVLFSTLTSRPAGKQYVCKLNGHTVIVGGGDRPDQTIPPYNQEQGGYVVSWDDKVIGHFPSGRFYADETFLSLHQINISSYSNTEMLVGKFCNMTKSVCKRFNTNQLPIQ